MKYLLMIYDDERARHALPPAEHAALYGEYVRAVTAMIAEGVYLGGEPLQATTTASSVRVRGGKLEVTDGPFAETREQLGGYFLVEAESQAAAIALAARIPGAQFGTIEVRPLAPNPGK